MPDPRFARLRTDPRFRRPRKQVSKVLVDERFKDVFDQPKTKGKTGKGDRVDKYGRPISDTHEQDNLKRFYRLEHEDDETYAGEPKAAPDYARGDVLLESSDEDEDDKAVEDDESDPGDVVTIGRDHSRPIAVTADDAAEIDLNENIFADLDSQAAAYDKSHSKTPQEEGTRTRRLAVVNIDWDHVRATHLFRIFSSLVLPTAPALMSSSSLAPVHSDRQRSIKGVSSNVVRGKVLGVRVYPSEFGKKRLQREEKEGPPMEVFKKRKDTKDEEVNEQNIYEVGEEDDYDEDALRKYQLERLRYYYAIVTCDTADTASHIYSELEGTELERSANVFDLSFVPDDMTFDDEYRDEASANLNTSYKSVDFVTDALRHSKVKFTWDEDDPERNQITRRTLSRQEIEEADFKAYLASSTSGSESEAGQPHPAESKAKKKDKKSASRNELRALLLGGGNDGLPEGWGQGEDDGAGDVDMEITFTPGLSESKGNKEETTLDKYQRKMKEKRRKRKDEVKGKASEKEKNGGVGDDFFDVGNGSENETEDSAHHSRKEALKKKHKDTKDRQTSSEALSRQLISAEELSLLVSSDNPNAVPRHFNWKSVLKAEKRSKGKGKKGKRKGESNDNEVQENFSINVKDDRFGALHDNHTFAIDPSNPHFKKTKSMAALLDERSKRQKEKRGDDSDAVTMKMTSGDGDRSLKSLVESVKRKSVVAEQTGTKRRKL